MRKFEKPFCGLICLLAFGASVFLLRIEFDSSLNAIVKGAVPENAMPKAKQPDGAKKGE